MKNYFKKLKEIVQKVVNIQIKIILFVFYFIFITPFGIVIRLFKDYLKIKSNASWLVYKEISNIADFLRDQ